MGSARWCSQTSGGKIQTLQEEFVNASVNKTVIFLAGPGLRLRQAASICAIATTTPSAPGAN
jgi:hypothetical protein